MTEVKFNRIEQIIMKVMFQQRVALTTYEIAKECQISYMTARKYCQMLSGKGILNFIADRNKYQFNYEIFNEDGEVK